MGDILILEHFRAIAAEKKRQEHDPVLSFFRAAGQVADLYMASAHYMMVGSFALLDLSVQTASSMFSLCSGHRKISFPAGPFQDFFAIPELQQKLKQAGQYMIAGYFPHEIAAAPLSLLEERMVIVMTVRKPNQCFELYQGSKGGEGVVLRFECNQDGYTLSDVHKIQSGNRSPVTIDQACMKAILSPFIESMTRIQNRQHMQRRQPLPEPRQLPRGAVHLVTA